MARLGIGSPLPVGAQPLEQLLELAEKSEELGYDSFWVHENPLYGDSIAALMLVIWRTKRISIGLGCTSVITRHPVLLASSAITLQNASGGRFLLGVGLGGFPWLPLIGYPVQPVERTRPLRRLMEAMRIIRSLTRGEDAALEGDFYTVKGLKLMARPLHPIPLYLASLGRKTLGRAALVADGAITSPGVATPSHVASMLAWVEDGEARYARRIDKAAYVIASVDESAARAYGAVKANPYFIYQLAEVVPEQSLIERGVSLESLPKLREAWRRRDLATASSLVSDEMVRALTASGTPGEARRALQEYLDRRLDLVIISPVGNVLASLRCFRGELS